MIPNTPASPVGPETRFRAAEHVYARELDGELVLLDLGGGEYYALDEIGARLWRGLERDGTAQAVAAELEDEYDVPPEILLRDLVALAQDLVQRGLLIPAAP